LIRLLELPGVVNEWLKAFFNLFLKYERILRCRGLPKNWWHLAEPEEASGTCCGIPAKSVLYAVSIPTVMALEETGTWRQPAIGWALPSRGCF
jgi:arsenite-transporting ATPase